MHAILQMLEQDHRNARRLLAILDRETARVAAEEEANFTILRDLMRYMVGYADRVHHPREEAVYARLQLAAGRNGQSDRTLDAMTLEHGTLAGKGQALLAALEQIADGGFVVRAALVGDCHGYREKLARHMEEEEKTLFPRAAAELDEVDWQAVSDAVEARQDPLFGPVVEGDFENLLAHIEHHAEDGISASTLAGA